MHPTHPLLIQPQLTADLKRKAAQLDAADNQITLLRNENAALKAAKAELEKVHRGESSNRGTESASHLPATSSAVF